MRVEERHPYGFLGFVQGVADVRGDRHADVRFQIRLQKRFRGPVERAGQRTKAAMIAWGVVLVLAGVFAIAAPYSLYAAIQLVAGVALVVHGRGAVYAYIKTPELFRNSALVVSGILNGLVGHHVPCASRCSHCGHLGVPAGLPLHSHRCRAHLVCAPNEVLPHAPMRQWAR